MSYKPFAIGQHVISTHAETVIVNGRFHTFPVGSRATVSAYDKSNPDEIGVRYLSHPKWRVWTSIEWFKADSITIRQTVIDLQAELEAMRESLRQRTGGAA